ncbi:MAG: universal stress protein [Clostridium sp.]|jgi:nucleotide-binding universal stress UspA family protein|uniref:universal stress protein n=1 Tax=Clostridium sp. TaxID=1506 RepID=UPI0025BAC195|nr:universal stress protein [Clostridium sp.]MCH3966002.1 universal stress protein [Clostridium sp.]MCI1715910.1 universal stress protein [Clostridium sp.]MCI1800418.1 universal stress protein [Clostridium sp.]MCI1814087.1 universal stress protein [Clostridium sp.]MCI1870985.1 universal stress protein [Clostridium sp.]
MSKKKILVPLDGTERSMHSLDWLKKMFRSDSVKITLMNIKEIVIANDMVITNDEIKRVQKESEDVLNDAEKQLEGYEVEKYCAFGYAADEILLKAKRDNYDMIIMTKSTKKGLARMIGSVTSKVVKNAQTLVMIVPE